MARSAYREAAASIEQAMAAPSHLAESRDTIEQAIDLRLELRSALFTLAPPSAIIEHLREAERLAEVLGDQSRMGRVAAFLCISYGQGNDLEQGVEAGERALVLAAALEDVPLLAVVRTHLAGVHIRQGHYAPAKELLGANVELLDGERARERFGMVGYPSVVSRSLLVWCLSEQGDFAEGIAHGRAGLELAEELGQPYSLGVTTLRLGSLYLRRGDHAEAIRLLERSLDICQRGDVVTLAGGVAQVLAYAYALAGRSADALLLINRATRWGDPRSIANAGGVGVSKAYLLCGQIDDAAHLARVTLDHARSLKSHVHVGWALQILGEVAALRSDADEAEHRYRASLALAEQLEMRPLQAHCHVGLGKLFRRLGRPDQARAELATAVAMLREMGMTFWLPEAERELAEM